MSATSRTPAEIPGRRSGRPARQRASDWLAASKLGLLVMALIVGVGAGLAAARVIVACGAAGGISATLNAPLTGLFFGFEIVLKEFSLDALAATTLSAVTADVISRAFFGEAPFFAAAPLDLNLTNDFSYLLIALLGITAGLIGVGFQKTLYRGKDAANAVWRGRPAWLRPIVGACSDSLCWRCPSSTGSATR